MRINSRGLHPSEQRTGLRPRHHTRAGLAGTKTKSPAGAIRRDRGSLPVRRDSPQWSKATSREGAELRASDGARSLASASCAAVN